MVRVRLSQMQKGEWGIKKTSKMLLKEVQIVLANKPDVQVCLSTITFLEIIYFSHQLVFSL